MSANTSVVNLALVYKENSTNSENLCKGFSDAFAENSPTVVQASTHSYTDDGLAVILEVIENGADIIIGPSESDVFLEAKSNPSVLESNVPIISPLIIASVPYEAGDYFFSTNVDVNERVQHVFDFFDKYGMSNATVVYEDSEWGRRAQEYFAQLINPEGANDQYEAYAFTPNGGEARDAVDRIFDDRPGYVGIFSEREHVNEIMQLFKVRNNPLRNYNPVVFTINDIRHESRLPGSDINDIYSVVISAHDLESGTMIAIDGTDNDVYSLSHDTTLLVLSELDQAINGALGSESIKRDALEAFHTGFTAALEYTAPLAGSKSSMQFQDFQNGTTPQIAYVNDGQIRLFDWDDDITLQEVLTFRFENISRRFGFWPFLNVLVVVLVLSTISIFDLTKWYTGPFWSLLSKSAFWIFLGITNLMGLTLYIMLAESGVYRYDNTVAALLVAITPIAAIKTSLIETSSGNIVGLTKLYDDILQYVNDKLMVHKHLGETKSINLVAYHNSIDGMKTNLEDLYKSQRSPERRVRLQTIMEQKLGEEKTYIRRRKVLARLLLRHLSFEELQKQNLAPSGDIERLRNPEIVLALAGQHCLSKPEIGESIKNEIDQVLEMKEPARKKDLKEALENDLNGIEGDQGRITRRLAFLCVLKGYSEQFLFDKGFLPHDYEIQLANLGSKGEPRRIRRNVANLFGRNRKVRAAKSSEGNKVEVAS